MLALAATGLVPEPALYGPTWLAPANELLVPYRKMYVVLKPLGFTVPFSVALVEVIAEAAPVVTVGPCGTLAITIPAPTVRVPYPVCAGMVVAFICAVTCAAV